MEKVRGTQLSRRQFLKATGMLAGVTAASAFLGACGGTKTEEAAGPLKLVSWDYRPAIVEENLQIYKEMYGEDVVYQPLPGTYQTVVETKLIGGEHIDVIYIHTDQINRWAKANWVRHIDDMPDVDEIKKALYPENLVSLSDLEGKLVALPYYAGYRAMMYNDEKLSQAGFQPPTSWEEFIDQCREMQGKGISQHPFIPYWISTEYATWSWFSMWYSEGEPVFDDNYEPTFQDGGVAFQKVLEMMKVMYDEQIVPPDVLTMKDHTGTFGTGEHVFLHHSNYIQQAVNNPETSKIPGQVKNALMPGSTHQTMAWTEGYAMSPNAPEDRAWELMKFLGYKDKEGEYLVHKSWALQAGLGSPYIDVMNDPEIVDAFSKWTDLSIWNEQQANSKARGVSQAFWYPEWNMFLVTTVHDYLQGKMPIGDTIKVLYDKVVELKAKYPD